MTTQYLATGGGTIAYDDTGGIGPLVVCLPGLGDLRSEYRHLAPLLARVGHRVVTVDLRGHGESSVGWSSYRPEDVGDDLVALLDELDAADGGGAVVLGCSLSAAAAVWAAAERPDAVAGLVLIGPFVRDLPIPWYQRALLRFMTPRLWASYLPRLSPTGGPSDLADHVASVRDNLSEPGRTAPLRAMLLASKDACEARIGEVDTPTRVLMGGADPDFPDPTAEAAHVAGQLGGSYVVLDDLGHYPHAEDAALTAQHVIDLVEQACPEQA
jgi:pimeloyl-ACP methyl ester carboxylesterase